MDDSLQNKENACTDPAQASPCVVKPKALCFKRKPKQLFPTVPLGSVDTNVDTCSSNSTLSCLSKSIASINPFKCITGPEKRRRITTERDCDFSSLCSNKKAKKDEQPSNLPSSQVVLAAVSEDANLEFGSTHFHGDTTLAKPESQQKLKELPVDWSLKTKIRITTAKPFPWRTSFRTSEEASGTTGFVRCLHSDKANCSLDSSHGARLYQQCLVWMHPSIPWLNLFPPVPSQTPSQNSLPSLDQKFVEVLRANWCDSFRSLYQLVRTCQCPYFYLCASTFTVMFRSRGVGTIIDIHAAITPTSRGLRKALKEEGIDFTMPLHPGYGDSGIGHDEKSVDYTQSFVDSQRCELDENSENLEDAEEEEPETWLESLGLSQQDFPSLSSRNAQRQKEHKNIDHHPESLVYIEGSETQGLVNFLINYPSCVSKFGPLAGVPPTLLSPVAFLGATLQANKVQHGRVQEKGQDLYAIELKGPLLPNAINSLCSLFSTTQNGNFKATMVPYQPTLAFARLPSSSNFPSIFATENLKDCGFPSAFTQHICSKSGLYEGKGISTVTVENGLYSWS